MLGIMLVSVMMGVSYASPSNTNDCCINNKCSHHHHLDLKLRDQDERWGDGVVATWTATNMAPGDIFTFEGSFVGLKSNNRGELGISCLYDVVEEFPQTEADIDPYTNLHPDSMAKYMNINSLIYSGKLWQIDMLTGELIWAPTRGNANQVLYTNNNWRLRDIDNNDRITFYDLSQAPVTNLPSPLWGWACGAYLRMSVSFDQDAGNEFQGDTLNFTMVFTLKPG
jgi:hypothetical protein